MGGGNGWVFRCGLSSLSSRGNWGRLNRFKDGLHPADKVLLGHASCDVLPELAIFDDHDGGLLGYRIELGEEAFLLRAGLEA